VYVGSISAGVFHAKSNHIYLHPDAPGGKLKERVDVLFAWMKLHQFTFHHLEN
jgi:hypothetical protein